VSDSITSAGPAAIEAAGVTKSFGGRSGERVAALAGVDLTVRPGTLAALLGPNGAGKTTLVRIIATLTRPDAGWVRVLGFDVTARPGQVRARIGLTGQYAGLDEALSGRDNLVLIGRLAGLSRRTAGGRAAELAALFGLTEAIGRPARTYSGGMRRRLDLAASLMTRPALLVLDEPTTGLDPGSRQQLWAVLSTLRAEGTTMLLTTQYLEEADRFADIVHVLNRGTIIASGTAAQLKARLGRAVVEVRLAEPAATAAAARVLTGRLALPPAAVHAEDGTGRLTVTAGNEAGDPGEAGEGTGTLLAAAAALRAGGLAVAGLSLRQPSLDEAFLALTGDRA
jgi:ABC-type multidrug transport system ATPase subunit